MRIGIQGGRGSFNEQALHANFTGQGKDFTRHRIEYLYTADRVLHELLKHNIDLGQFATVNSIGGLVRETELAKASFDFDHKFQVVATYQWKISHRLMFHPDAQVGDIDIIVTHEQVLLQCRSNLQRLFPNIRRTEGKDEWSAPARVALGIASGELSRKTATVSSPIIAKMNGLAVVPMDLQDSDDNVTTFALVGLKDNVLNWLRVLS
jgi:prephenate dehydratase